MKAILLGVLVTCICNVLRDKYSVYNSKKYVRSVSLAVNFTMRQNDTSGSVILANSMLEMRAEMPIPIMILVGTRVEYYNRVISAVVQANHQTTRIVFLSGVNLTNRVHLELPESSESIRFEVQNIHVPAIKDNPMRLKHIWFAAMHSVWKSPLLRNYDGNVVFLEDDVVPSPDFFVALDFACHSKSKTSIIQVISMGGWGGENQVNAEPNTFTMKVSSSFPTMGYAFDRGLWKEIATLEQTVLSDWVNTDWAESLALALCNQAISRHYPRELISFHRCNHIHIIQPTLSRVWHIGVLSQVGSHHESNAYRWPTSPSWALVNTLMQKQSDGVLLTGMHDVLGFRTSEWKNELDSSSAKFPLHHRHKLWRHKEQ
jgi:hypothetical protein